MFENEMKKFEHALVRGFLIRGEGNICKAAKLAGMHRNTFSRKVTSYSIDKRECRRIAKEQNS